jgi:hypothetical protein
MPQLQRLHMIIDTYSADKVAQLAQLPALQHLSLGYNTLKLAAATAHVWRQLPQLQELRVSEYNKHDKGTVLQMQSILTGIAAATSLTNLHLHSGSLANDDAQMSHASMADIAVCPMLAGLSRLEELCIYTPMGGSDVCDARALTALTGLTYLDLSYSRGVVTTDSATALARSLTRLRHLDLSSCHQVDLNSTELMLALGQLTQLTLLGIDQGWGDNRLTVGALMQLTGLRHLTDLRAVISSREVSGEVLRVFWEKVRGQQKVC